MSEFYYIKCYKDLLRMIRIHEKIIENALEEQKYYLKQLHATEPKDISSIIVDGQPHGNFSPLSLDRIIENLNRIDSLLEIENAQLERLKKAQKDILKQINNFTGLYFKVAYKREIEGKTLQEIADELGYSLGYIKNISAGIDIDKYDLNMTDKP